MRLSLHTLASLAVAAALLAGSRPAAAEGSDPDAAAVRRNEQTVERLRAELAKVNAEVAALKRGPRSLRSDYRLRERMADAEALAQKLTAAESELRPQNRSGSVAVGAPVVASPQASPQDGRIELEAKADLLADQARKLDGEADRLSRAADEMRTRKALRRKAGSWERDPFAGLESSRRSVVALPSPSKQATTGDTGGMAPTGTAPITLGPTASPPATIATSDSASKGAADGAAASKTSPLASSAAVDRQAVEQRLYLDPATAAELRHALGAGNAKLDPEALERGAAALRARARTLEAQARGLLTQSRAP